MKNKSWLVAIILVVITIVVVVLSSAFGKNDKDKNNIQIVTNYSNFYTVTSCLYRTVTYINAKDVDSLILILSEDYRNKNNIDTSNVLEIFPKVETNSTFVSRKMYYEKVNKNITKYYVYGYIEKEELSEDGELNNKDRDYTYFIVYLDTDNKVFSIEPYTGEIFMDGDTNG